MQSTLTMTREDWLSERRKGIGGSDAAAIMGMNPWRSPLAVYMDKLGLAPEIKATEAIRQGNDLEDYVARRFVEAFEASNDRKAVRRCNKILRHKEHDWMLANIDRDVAGEDAGLECKTTSPYNKTPFDQGEVPANYYWQCQHYMAVTGASHWYLAVLVHGKAFHIFDIARNDEHIARLIEAERAFWFDNVLAEIPPLPSGSDGDDDMVALLPASREPDEVADLQDMDTDITLMDVLKDEQDAIEQRIKAIRQRIVMTLDGAEAGRTNRWEISYKPQTTERLDSKRLKTERPDIAAAFTKVSTSRVMRVKEVKQ